MGLPITEYPLVEVYVYSEKKKVNFRPFLVKEEKLLVFAAETGEAMEMIKASQQIVTNCSFGKVKGDEIPIFDMQNIFLELRKASIGTDIEARFGCGHCEKKTNVTIDLNRFKLKESEDHSPIVKLTDEMSVEMRYPKSEELKEIAGKESDADIYEVSSRCIEKIFIKDEVYEEISDGDKREFIDNMPPTQFQSIRQFFETMPVLENKIEFICNGCGRENYAFMNGYMDFFV